MVLALIGFGFSGCSGEMAHETGAAYGGGSGSEGGAYSESGGSGGEEGVYDSSASMGGEGEGEGEGAGAPISPGTDSEGMTGSDEEGGDPAIDVGTGEEVEEQAVIQASQITAGEWDDNLNFDFYQQYLSDYLQLTPSMPAIPTGDRLVINVVDGAGAPVSNANVTILAGEEILLNAPTASDGRVLFFPGHDGAATDDQLTIEIEGGGAQLSDLGSEPLSESQNCVEGVCEFVLDGAEAELPASLDLAFVVDATGSMSDELEYLKTEIDYIAQSIEDDHPNLAMRFALIVYRDIGDKYVTRVADFTDNLDDFRATLEKQSANGGGDYPEAMDKALKDMNNLSWDDGNTARVAFLVADAPPHTEDASAFLDEVDVSRSPGIRVYTVAASGVADEAEYLMRVASQATLARYLFLTDDSGIGLSHAEPHIPCYHVQLLSDLTVRMVLSELSGGYVAPDSEKIVRTVGDVQDGVCTLADDSPAYLWLSE